MDDDDRVIRDLYAASMAATDAPHPDEGTWERLASGELARAEREALFDHVTRCAACTRVFRGLKLLEAEARAFDPGAPRIGDGRGSASPHRWGYAGLAAAAALVLAVLLPTKRPTEPFAPPADPLRSAAAAAPVPLEPTGILIGPPRTFRWQGVPSIDRYRVELSTAAGDLVWISPPVSATRIDWPASIPTSPGSYEWQVIPVPDVDRPLTSAAPSSLTSFEIPAPATLPRPR